MGQIERVLGHRGGADEVLHVLDEVAHRRVAVVAVVVLEGEVDVLRLEGQQRRVAAVAGAAADAHRRGDGLAALDVRVVRARDRLAVGEAPHHVVGNADLEVDIGQHHVVVAVERRELGIGRLHRREFVASDPVEPGICRRQGPRRHVCLLEANADPNVHRPVGQFRRHVRLRVDRGGFLRRATVRREAAGRTQPGAAVAHVRQLEDGRLAGGHQRLGSGDHLRHAPGVVVGLAPIVVAAGHLVEGARRRGRRQQVGDGAGLGDAAPGIALHNRTGRAVVHLGQFDAEVDALHEAGVEVVGAGELRLRDVHPGEVVREHAAGDDHVVRRQRVAQPQFQDRQVAAEVGGRLVAGERRHREQRRVAVGAVRRALRRRVVVVELQAELVGDIPEEIQPHRAVARFPSVLAGAHRVVAVRGVLGVDERRGLRAVGPDRLLAAEVEPRREVVVGALQLDFGERVVQRRREVFGGLELQRELAVRAQPLVFGDLVADGLRHGVQVVVAGAIDLVGVAGRRNAAPLGPPDAAPAVVHLARERAPAAHVRGVGAVVAILAHDAQRHASAVVVEGVGEQRRHLRREAAAVLRRTVVHSTRRRGEVQPRRVQRARGADVERRADAAGGHVRLAGLVDLHRAHGLRSEIAEVEGAVEAAVGGHLPPVQQHQIERRPEAAHGDGLALAPLPVDGHAGDALQRLRQVGVREVADVLGRDGVHDAVPGALEIH